MLPYIVLPLADNEQSRLPNIGTQIIPIKTSKLRYPFNSIFFAQTGKFIQSYSFLKFHFHYRGIKHNSLCFIQNRRYFVNFDVQLKQNEVVLAPREWLGRF